MSPGVGVAQFASPREPAPSPAPLRGVSLCDAAFGDDCSTEQWVWLIQVGTPMAGRIHRCSAK